MANNDMWWLDLESQIFTIIKTRTIKELSEYELNFTDEKINIDTIFPTVYLQELPSQEIGKTLDNDGINAVIETIQIEVYVDTDKSTCKEIMGVIVNQFKKLQFDVMGLPIFTQKDNIHIGTARFMRKIGADDTLTN